MLNLWMPLVSLCHISLGPPDQTEFQGEWFGAIGLYVRAPVFYSLHKLWNTGLIFTAQIFCIPRMRLDPDDCWAWSSPDMNPSGKWQCRGQVLVVKLGLTHPEPKTTMLWYSGGNRGWGKGGQRVICMDNRSNRSNRSNRGGSKARGGRGNGQNDTIGERDNSCEF